MRPRSRKIRVNYSAWNSPAQGIGMFLEQTPGMSKKHGDYFTTLEDKTYVPSPVAIVTVDFIEELDKRNIAFTVADSMKLHTPRWKAPFYYVTPDEGDGHPMTSYDNTLKNVYRFFGQSSGALLDFYMKNIDILPQNENSFRGLEHLYKAMGPKGWEHYGIRESDSLPAYWRDRFFMRRPDSPEVLKNELFIRNGWAGA
jgi:hypothetical protein